VDPAKIRPLNRHKVLAIEQGHYSPSLERGFRFARVFGVGIEDVLAWEDQKRSRQERPRFRGLP